MASLKKRGRRYYIRFSLTVDGKRIRKAYSLGTNYKSVAQKKLETLEKLHQQNIINPFHPDFDVDSALRDPEKDKPYNLKEARNLFIKSKQHLKPATIEFYKRNLDHFLNHQDLWLKPLNHFRKHSISEFLFRGGLSASAIHANARALKAFGNFFSENEWIGKNPVLSISLPKKEVSYHNKMLTKKELDLMFKEFDKYHKTNSKEKWYKKHHEQDWFKPLIATYFYTGMRLHEAAYSPKLAYSGLKGRNLIRDVTLIHLLPTKGHKERYIPISKHLRPLLLHYFKTRGVPKADEYVFVHEGGRYDGFPVRGRAAREAFNEYLKKAEIDTSRTMHGMRHQRVTAWIEAGFSMKEASMMAGHSSTAVTENIYTHLAFEDLADKMKRLEDSE